MTTNHVERLAPALVRPGRVDVRLAYAHATSEQARKFFASFYRVGVTFVGVQHTLNSKTFALSGPPSSGWMACCTSSLSVTQDLQSEH